MPSDTKHVAEEEEVNRHNRYEPPQATPEAVQQERSGRENGQSNRIRPKEAKTPSAMGIGRGATGRAW